MGRHPQFDNKWVYILKDATLSYRQKDINKFVDMWNEGQPINAIAEVLNVKLYDVGLLVMHCELENLIQPRPGGLLGSKKHTWKKWEDKVKISP
jgi:hypothetical protein